MTLALEAKRSRLTRWVLPVLLPLSSACRQPTEPVPDTRHAPASAALPSASSPGPASERVRVVARHHLGVPLHPALGAPDVSGRLPDGAWVKVVAKSDDGRWAHVIADDGTQGWLTQRYLTRVQTAPETRPTTSIQERRPSIWSSKGECRRELASLGAARKSGTARLMSYNLRWFPDGIPGKRAGQAPTDIEWLACAIAVSKVDVVLLQEIKTTPRARQELALLTTALNRHTGGSFEVQLDPCPIETSQHVGLLYDGARTKASHFQVYPGVNPHGDPCRDQLRPGFGGFFEFPGGLDLHVVSVHLKSGGERRDHELRLRSLAGFQGVVRSARSARADDDIVIGGDLNTMGCRHCSPKLSASEELELFALELGRAVPAWSFVGPRPSCSEYHAGSGVLLDHFVVSGGLSLLTEAAESRVTGYCEDRGCRPFEGAQVPAAYRSLSDHCPVLLELRDRDDDPG